uniref:DNA methylase adenine-specific domain-containing protein n=1 Tax=Halimeda micronesica TaxID=170426 RepID=A0A386AXD9_9CHLO|nr:hypothetical protein [Halimeda micronesica]
MIQARIRAREASIERCINLLKKGCNGILSIILPNGYLTNPSLKYILARFASPNGRIIGIISLPEGVFKKSNAGGFTTILFFQKQNVKGNYNIFIDIANKIGFDQTKKNAPKRSYLKKIIMVILFWIKIIKKFQIMI